jgi:hypothetical protein
MPSYTRYNIKSRAFNVTSKDLWIMFQKEKVCWNTHERKMYVEKKMFQA